MDSEEYTSAPKHIAPQRSTLKDNFSPYVDASLSLGQVKQDLESLKRQECSVQSIETVRYHHKTDEQFRSNVHDDVLKSFVRSSFQISKKRRRSRRMRTLNSIVDDSGAVHGHAGVRGDADVASGGVNKWGSSLYVQTYGWEF
ncbi:unnamed protein product [Dovyalis caffra]|uniref:Uncharacterized protein n=1 Tax=Dovyalis caffra TaxID=77055 RepID=A0AAV1QX91_9ROSI|nr:unnamed protein product [Dovyalis caffra]